MRIFLQNICDEFSHTSTVCSQSRPRLCKKRIECIYNRDRNFVASQSALAGAREVSQQDPSTVGVPNKWQQKSKWNESTFTGLWYHSKTQLCMGKVWFPQIQRNAWAALDGTRGIHHHNKEAQNSYNESLSHMHQYHIILYLCAKKERPTWVQHDRVAGYGVSRQVPWIE